MSFKATRSVHKGSQQEIRLLREVTAVSSNGAVSGSVLRSPCQPEPVVGEQRCWYGTACSSSTLLCSATLRGKE